MAAPTKARVIVVGGGLAGLMTTVKIAEAGGTVDLFSLVPVKRSHSVCAQGGINGAVNTKGEGDSPAIHLDDTCYGGDFLANQTLVKDMCDAAPGIIYLLDRMGVMFNRTPEGLLDFRRFGGTLHHRTAYAGATTGQQLLYALDEQTRRYEVAGKVNKFEFWEFLGIVRDQGGAGKCVGIVAQDLRSMEIRAFAADAVVLATGGTGIVFGKSTNSTINTGTASGAVHQQGAWYANGEFVQVHPTAVPGEDKLRLISESVRGEGGRVWVPKTQGDPRKGQDIPESERWYFLEEKYPKYGNLVPRDIATREIFAMCVDQKMGVYGQNQVYLDVTHIDRRQLDLKLRGVLEIYEKFVGDDPRDVPMRIFPAVHYSMGGLWVNDGLDPSVPKHQTNIAGLFAVGECDYQYHGANRLGANSLLSCLTSGQLAGPEICKYADGLEAHPDGTDPEFGAQLRARTEQYERIKAMNGPENPFELWHEMGQLMTENMTVVRYNDRLRQTETKLQELQERYQRIGVSDASGWTNQVLPFTRQLGNMLVLARVMTRGALQRDESRGAHYKPDFPDRDDANFQKTTVAEHTPDSPAIRYESVDLSQVKPRPRKYTTDAPASPTPVQVAGQGKVPVGANGMNTHANGYAANGESRNGVADGLSGDAGRTVPAQVPGEEVAQGGTAENDPLSTAPAGGHPRDAGTGTEASDTAPNMAELEPGKGGAN
uniref:succinate dehydrogenase n=1 Tax=uncultured Armatimonadetes bacterium TaxID=157466 RepID=A0A6J4K471_9BACT|nr:Succinate dehydrogenase flavoprotein subunit [uncultured Armatimonadetes bacterium]